MSNSQVSEMDTDLQSLQHTIAALHRLLETPVAAEQIDLNVPREMNGPIFDIPFYIGNAGSSCLSTSGCNSRNLSTQYNVEHLPSGVGREFLNRKSAENVQNISGSPPVVNGNVEDLLPRGGREVLNMRRTANVQMLNRKRTTDVQNITDCLPNLNGNMEDLLSGPSREVVKRKRTKKVEKITGCLPDLNRNPGDGKDEGMLPKPNSLNRMSAHVRGDSTVAAEPFTKRGNTNFQNTNTPAFSVAKMPEIIQKKCQDAISMIMRKIDDEGHKTIPLLSHVWRRRENSINMMSMAGIDIMNFEKICQRLDQRNYNGVFDFVADFQSLLKAVAEQFQFSSMVRNEVQKVEALFFDIMKRTFPDTDFHRAQGQPQSLV